MAKLIGNKPDQVPTNGDLGTLAFQDSDNVIVENLTVATSVIGNVTGQVSDISNHSTTNLSEGTNLYYTDTRVDARIAASPRDNQKVFTASGSISAGDVVALNANGTVSAGISGDTPWKFDLNYPRYYWSIMGSGYNSIRWNESLILSTTDLTYYNQGYYVDGNGITYVLGASAGFDSYSDYFYIKQILSANWIGIAAENIADTATGLIDLPGAINRSQTGLTTNSIYYVDATGSLTTTPTIYGKIGRAYSATELQIFESYKQLNFASHLIFGN